MGTWDLLLSNTKEAVEVKFPEFFSYSGGYRQGSSRSEYTYFLTTTLFGSDSNGSGRSSQAAPKPESAYSGQLLKWISKMLNDPADYKWKQGQHFVDIRDKENKLGLST